MCSFDMTAKGRDGQVRKVLKLTRLMTNSEVLSRALNQRCSGDHEHETLLNGKAAGAGIWPDKLCETIVGGFRAHLEAEQDAGHIEIDDSDPGGDTPVMLMDIAADDPEDEPPVDLGNMETALQGWFAEDDVKGGSLKPELVQEARAQEMTYFKSRRIYDYYDMDKALGTHDPPLVGVKWIDTTKGDEENPLYRSRLVAQEFRKK
jgi:hypothetical protein